MNRVADVMKFHLVFMGLALAFAYWLAVPSELPPREHFSPFRRLSPSTLFHGPGSQNIQVRSESATLNVFYSVQENARASRLGTAVILFLHGMPESARTTWDATVSLLEKKSLNARRVVFCAFDLRGFNSSLIDEGSSFLLSAIDYTVMDVVQVINTLKTRLSLHDDDYEVHLVSHDLGAVAAWAVWQRSSLGPQLKSTTIINVPHLQAYRDVFFSGIEQLIRSWYIIFFHLPTTLIQYKLLGNNGALLQNAFLSTRLGTYYIGDLDDLLEMWSTPGVLHSMLNMYRTLLVRTPCSNSYCVSEAEKAPINIIWGMKDWVFVSKPLLCSSEYYAKRFGAPQVNLYPLHDVNHYVAAETPEIVADVVAGTINSDATANKFLNHTLCE